MFKFRFTALFFMMASLVLFSACDDNPADDDHDEHADAEGLVLRANGQQIVEVKEGVVTGSITVEAGDETALIQVEFRDHDGHEVHAEDLDAEFSLGYSFGDASIAGWEQHDGERWEFHVLGLAAGTTTLELQLLHNDHADFRTPPITVEVVQ